MSTAVRGTIAREYVARCGKCGMRDQFPVAKRQDAARWFVSIGWLHTRLYGWVCPDCAKHGDGKR